MNTKEAVLKTYEQRQKELEALTTKVKAQELDIPADVVEIAKKLDGFPIVEILSPSLHIQADKIAKFVSKKTGKEGFTLYDTGYYPVELRQLGSRTLKLKLSLSLA